MKFVGTSGEERSDGTCERDGDDGFVLGFRFP